MNSLVRILQVRCGDAIIVKYANKKKNIIIDGGYLTTYLASLQPELMKIRKEKGEVKPWILTHLDADHINGFISFIRDPNFIGNSLVKELWFNCFDKLNIPEVSNLVSVGKGIEICEALKDKDIFLNHNVISGLTYVDDDVRIEILAPDKDVLTDLEKHWRTEENAFNKKVTQTIPVSAKKSNDYNKLIKELSKKKDAAVVKADITNRSSIVFMLYIDGKSILFLGDAYSTTVANALKVKKRPVVEANSNRLYQIGSSWK